MTRYLLLQIPFIKGDQNHGVLDTYVGKDCTKVLKTKNYFSKRIAEKIQTYINPF